MVVRSRSWEAFVRLWFLLAFPFVLVKLLADLIGGGYVDLRSVALAELAVVPLAQAIVCWIVTRRGRAQLQADEERAR